MTIRVLLADDEVLIRAGLRAVLECEDDLSVVGEASTGAEVLPLVRRLRPDIVLMDVRMPDVDGIQATRHIVDHVPDPPKILVVTTFENDEYVYDALRAGASGFLLKRAPVDTIPQAIRVVVHGDCLLFPSAIRAMADRWARPGSPSRTPAPQQLPVTPLTEREAEVLRLMAAGLANAEIADRLHITGETVKTHVSNVLAKLGARDRTQAVIAAYESGFVEAHPRH